jgi:hypothetical protein
MLLPEVQGLKGKRKQACAKMEGNSIGLKAGYLGLVFSDNGS